MSCIINFQKERQNIIFKSKNSENKFIYLRQNEQCETRVMRELIISVTLAVLIIQNPGL